MGRISQSALDRYSLRESESGAANFHMATLAFRFVELWERDGWDFFYADPASVSLLFPFKTAVEGAPSENLQTGDILSAHLASRLPLGGLKKRGAITTTLFLSIVRAANPILSESQISR